NPGVADRGQYVRARLRYSLANRCSAALGNVTVFGSPSDVYRSSGFLSRCSSHAAEQNLLQSSSLILSSERIRGMFQRSNSSSNGDADGRQPARKIPRKEYR